MIESTDINKQNTRRIELPAGTAVSDIDIAVLTGSATPPPGGDGAAATATVIVADSLGNRAAVISHLPYPDNVTIYFRATSPSATTDALILSSLGYRTGIVYTPESPLGENHLSLITYQFYSTSDHGDIEPWASMGLARLRGLFTTPRVTLPDAGEDTPDSDGLLRWQRVLLAGGDCAFCPAMRLCEGFFETRDNHDECRQLMMEARECTDFLLCNDICRQ